MRQTARFPNLIGSQFDFPRRNESYRVVSCWAQGIVGGGSSQFVLAISDGAGNSVAAFATGFANAGITQNVTWAPCNFATDIWLGGGLSGQLSLVPIPNDLWIQPQWTLRLILTPNDPADQINNITIQTESFEKSVGKKGRTIEPESTS